MLFAHRDLFHEDRKYRSLGHGHVRSKHPNSGPLLYSKPRIPGSSHTGVRHFVEPQHLTNFRTGYRDLRTYWGLGTLVRRKIEKRNHLKRRPQNVPRPR